MPRLSETRRFLQSSSFWEARHALIGQLSSGYVIGRMPPWIAPHTLEYLRSTALEQCCKYNLTTDF